MIKYIVYGILAVIIIVLIIGGIHLCRVYFKNKKEMSPYMGKHIEAGNDFGKVLVVYYSLSGNTRAIAEKIAEKTGADVYEIKTKEAFPAGPKMYMEVKKQLKTGKYPALHDEELPDFESYDIIFVGAPVWWYTAATPALAFLEQADFCGKKVVPFSTQGSNPGTFVKDFKEKARNAVILEERLFNNLSKKYDEAVDNKISAWLAELGETK
ncbi:MAG: flavodoxin [Endomicrobia bacterium]|nr:flavodoxin [Endomicrobiia bacterium]MCL2144810.1 flavodoxin [Endomicrobiia bacterium]